MKQPASFLWQRPVAELVQILWWHNVVISEYELVRSLPDELRSSLPTIEQIEVELQQNDEYGE